MELAKPQIPEKPPIAAKPKLRAAPPRPPKPSTSSSLSKLSLPSSSAQSSHTQSHSVESHVSQNGLSKTFNSSTSKPKLRISAKAYSVETLSPSSERWSPRSPEPPPLPAFPPPVQRRETLSPSTSFSLPASFRNKNVYKVHTPLTLTTLIPFTPSSPASPSSSQKSPIRHVSPPRKARPTCPKPKHHLTASSSKSDTISGIVDNTREPLEAEERKPVVNDVQPPHIIPETNTHADSESVHLETQNDSKPVTSIAPTRKHSAAPPQRPTSPPSRFVPCPEKSINPPSKPSPPVVPTKPPESGHREKEVNIAGTKSPGERKADTKPPGGRKADTKSPGEIKADIKPPGERKAGTKPPGERKQVVPPPLPKNPPRGGVPRKPRHSSFRLTPATETRVPVEEGQQTPEPTLAAHDKASDNTCTESGVTFDDVAQLSSIQINSQNILLQGNENKDSKVLSDVSSAHANSISTSQSSSEISNITNSQSCVSKTKTPPKPRPRTRPSLVSLNDGESFIQKPASVDSSKHNENSVIQSSAAGSAGPDASIAKEPELVYAEAYQGDSDDHIDLGVVKCNLQTEGDTSQNFEQSDVNTSDFVQNIKEISAIPENPLSLKQLDMNICQTVQNTEETCAILMNPASCQQADVSTSQPVQNFQEINAILNKPLSSKSDSNSKESVSGEEVINLISTTVDSGSLLQEEPEATCGMLKEIEELLKNKLGDLEFDLENRSAEDLTRHFTEDTGHHSGGEIGMNCENSFCGPQHGSPVRPPRPKHQASISKHLGSLESLNSSVDDSATECLTNSGLSKTTGLSKGIGKKVIPPKPKRASAPRVSRSHSDVTGMKSIADGNNSASDAPEQLLQDDAKPFLPPRLESLRRSESSSSCQGPPPLPPRNKPRSDSLKEMGGADTDPPALQPRSSLSDLSSNSKTQSEMSENLDQSSQNITQSGLQPAQLRLKVSSTTKVSSSKVTSPAKPRPARKAPPPPPGSPRRSATFSSGDNKQPDAGQSNEQTGKDTGEAPASPTVKRSSSAVCKRPNTEVEDHDYHEISDTMRIRGEVSSQEKEETPPPALPPRASKADSEDSQTSLVSDTPEEDSVKLSENSIKYQTADSQSPKVDKPTAEVKSHIPKEQKHIEKMAKSVLIQKVTQGLGLGKSFKKSRVPEITLVIGEPNKSLADDSGNEKLSTPCPAVAESATDTKDPVISVAAQDVEQIDQKKAPATETPSSSTSSVDRPLSEVSQQSTGSEQEGGGQAFESQNMEEIVSSGTDTEPEEDKEEIYVLRKAKKVFFIAKEIISSESTFVDVLKLLNVDFRLHISKSTENLGHPVVPSETLNKILDFLPQLQNFNEDLLKDLTGRIENWELNPRLADIFVKKGPFLKLYSSYIRNFENATAILEDAVKKNSAFASALKEFEMSPRCARLALKHYMLKPIQRIPQYKLLLQDYLKHLTEGSPDYKDTVTALNIVSEVADHANDSMRHGDNVQKLLEVQRSLIGQFEVIQPGRVLMKQGELLKLSRKEMHPRMFFLFNDVLLYTTPATSGFKINNILPLTGMKINSPKLEDYKFEFNIISVQRSFTLSASSPEEKEQWVSALQTAIEENAKKHHTFQAVRHGPQTSLLDKDFVLGHKAPLWVPDARVTMCMLCLVEFTLTWRRHHCRSCGRVVCSHCSDNKAPLRYLKYESARVCDNCFENLRADMTSEFEQNQGKSKRRTLSLSEEDSTTSVSEGAEDSVDGDDGGSEAVKHDSGLSLNNLMARFQKIRISTREKRKPNNFRPSVLKEVHANDEGSDMSGYLRVYRSRKWKRLWFVVKGKILYTYKASEDMAATESMPLLGYEVTRINTWFEGAEPDLLFELTHQNNQPLTSRKEGDPRVVPGTEKTTQRLIFRTDSATATTKWVTVLREASLTY